MDKCIWIGTMSRTIGVIKVAVLVHEKCRNMHHLWKRGHQKKHPPAQVHSRPSWPRLQGMIASDPYYRFSWKQVISSRAVSQLMRSNWPLPLFPTRRIRVHYTVGAIDSVKGGHWLATEHTVCEEGGRGRCYLKVTLPFPWQALRVSGQSWGHAATLLSIRVEPNITFLTA